MKEENRTDINFFKVCNGVRDCPDGGDEYPLPKMSKKEEQPASVAYAHNWSIAHKEKACLVKTEKTDSTSILLPILVLVCLVTLLLAVYLVMLQTLLSIKVTTMGRCCTCFFF